MSLGFGNDTWTPGGPVDEPEDWHEHIEEPVDDHGGEGSWAEDDNGRWHLTGDAALAQALAVHQDTEPRFRPHARISGDAAQKPTEDPVGKYLQGINGGAPASEAIAAAVGTAGATTADNARVARLRANLLDREQLRNVPPSRYLIKSVLDFDSESWLIGASGGFKSFMAIDWACHVATGTPWWGMRIRKGKVFYIVAEGARSFGKRIDAWELANGETADDLIVLPMPVQASAGEYRDVVSGDWFALCQLAAEMQPVFIILDTQARMTVGLEENSNTAMGIWVDAVGKLRRATGACVLVVHHTGRNGQDARGASALDGAQDTEWKVARTGGDKSKRTAKLSCEKSKDGDDTAVYEFTAHVVELGEDDEGDPITSLVVRQDNRAGDEPRRVLDGRAAVDDATYDHDVNLRDKTAEVLYVLAEVGNQNGLTKSELRTAVNGLRTQREVEEMTKTTFYRIVDDSIGAGKIVVEKSRLYHNVSHATKVVAESQAAGQVKT